MNSISKGKCINLNYCSLAKGEVLQEVFQENEFKCQECERALSPIGSDGAFKLVKPILLVVSVLLVFGCLAYYFVSENWIKNLIVSPIEEVEDLPGYLITQEEDFNHIELKEILLYVGNENVDFKDRLVAADKAAIQYFSPQARIKEIGLNGTVVKIHMAKDYLIYLSSIITLKDIEILGSKMSNEDSKYREVSLREKH